MKNYAIFSKGCERSIIIENKIKNKIQLNYNEKKPDILFVIGGDGTILRAFHNYIEIIEDVTIIGIHTGHLGFLANYKEEDIDGILDVLNLEVECKIERQTILEFEITSKLKELNGLALNEVAITSNTTKLELDVLVDDSLLETFRGGGLCVSTPLGSTGYNKSLGGAVIDHNIDCLQISELAGINSNSYKTLNNSLVLSGHRTITFNNIGNDNIIFSYDNEYSQIEGFVSVTIKQSSLKVKFACINEENFVARINKAFL